MLQGKMAKSKTQEGIKSMAENVRSIEIAETEQVGTKRIIIKAGTLLLIAKSETEMRAFAMSLVRSLFDFPADWQRIVAQPLLYTDERMVQILMLF